MSIIWPHITSGLFDIMYAIRTILRKILWVILITWLSRFVIRISVSRRGSNLAIHIETVKKSCNERNPRLKCSFNHCSLANSKLVLVALTVRKFNYFEGKFKAALHSAVVRVLWIHPSTFFTSAVSHTLLPIKVPLVETKLARGNDPLFAGACAVWKL